MGSQSHPRNDLGGVTRDILVQTTLPALMPHKRGPKEAHKLTTEVLAFLRQVRQEDPSLRPATLASRLQDHFGITVHPRSIERALVRSQKKPQ